MSRKRPACLDCRQPLHALNIEALRRFPGPALCDRCKARRVLCSRCGQLRHPEEMGRPYCLTCRSEYDAERYARRGAHQ